jgi:hypothetical protein
LEALQAEIRGIFEATVIDGFEDVDQDLLAAPRLACERLSRSAVFWL